MVYFPPSLGNSFRPAVKFTDKTGKWFIKAGVKKSLDL
jgi:hypothetical protein